MCKINIAIINIISFCTLRKIYKWKILIYFWKFQFMNTEASAIKFLNIYTR